MKKFISVLFCLILICVLFSSCKPSGKITVTEKNGETLFEISSFSYDKWQDTAGDKFSFIKNALGEAVRTIAEKEGTDEKSAQNYLLKNNCNISTSFDDECFKAVRSSYQKNLEDSVEFGAVITDTSGAVLALYNNSLSGTDNTTAPKNPYSTIKPLSVYAPAIEAKTINWSSMFEDSEYKKITREDGKLYSWPVNATNKYSGENETVADGIKQSLNTVAVKCLKKFGVKNSIAFLRKSFGINLDDESRKAEIYGEEEILGNIAMGYLSKGVTVTDMAGYYSVFVNEGEYEPVHFVEKITDDFGNLIYEYKPEKTQVISRETANIMNRMLKCVVTPGATGEKANVDGVEICGKTGTGNGNEGNWFVGFSPNYICAVWHGKQMNENLSPQVFSDLFKNIPQENPRFGTFMGINQAAYCTDSGMLLSAGCRDMEVGYFTPDNMPDKCNVH